MRGQENQFETMWATTCFRSHLLYLYYSLLHTNIHIIHPEARGWLFSAVEMTAYLLKHSFTNLIMCINTYTIQTFPDRQTWLKWWDKAYFLYFYFLYLNFDTLYNMGTSHFLQQIRIFWHTLYVKHPFSGWILRYILMPHS